MAELTSNIRVSQPLKEHGLPILLRTGCAVGGHVFTWASGSSDSEPPKTLPCSCGLYTYKEWQKLWADSTIRNDETEGR